MQKVAMVYNISNRGAEFPTSDLIEVEKYSLTESELRKFENKIRSAGGFDCVTVINIIPLRKDERDE